MADKNNSISLSTGTLLSILGLIITVLTLIVTGAWTLSVYMRDSEIADLKSKVDIYEKSDKWKLPDILLKINLSSEKLNLKISERERLNFLEAEHLKLNDDNRKLTSELSIKENELKLANDYIESIVSKKDNFILALRNSHELTANNLYISMQAVGSDYVDIQFGEKPYKLELGKSIEYAEGNLKCKLFLTSIDFLKDNASFAKNCKKEK